MKKLIILFMLIGFVSVCWSFRKSEDPLFQFHEKLSDYGFFSGSIKDLRPADGVIPYSLNTPLFSNYAEKLRFIKMPAGTKAVYNDTGIFSLPKGTVLIKNFYFPNDFRKPEKGRRIIETRLLAHREEGWSTYQYIWNEEQTEAIFEPIGDAITVTYIDAKGKKVNSPYVIPNQNQCKGCHAEGNKLLPIGIAARHLNGNFEYPAKQANQLAYWSEHNMINIPADIKIPANAVWQDKSASLDSRARSYLDINCGFCHNPNGPANTSGLFLNIHNSNLTALGINKPPVAAGRGSGNFEYDIVPGSPAKSILVYRMTSTDPGIAMPEIGRENIHKEGVALISEWIKSLK